ncbi:MAG: tryptophan halogenase family protein [Robiginitomaculum sp.]
MSDISVNSVIIIGGGTSGWLTAAYLSQELGSYLDNGVKITLIEASDVPTVGVGEGTFPTLRTTLAKIGLDEADFIREADATFKQGLEFVNWQGNPTDEPHSYYHLFEPPRRIQNQIDLAPYWAMKPESERGAFARSVSFQQDICEGRMAPKSLSDASFMAPMNYAYHLDAGKFAQVLKKRAKFARVEHVVGKVTGVNQTPDGNIESVTLADGAVHKADLFIDCSGFKALLIGETLGEPKTDVRDTLFVDSAVVIRVPHDSPDAPIASATICTAHEAGWSWDIGLKDRRGIGYTYSSKYSTKERAEEVLRGYLKGAGADLEMRHVPMETGYRKVSWKKNCVAVGLSSGFLEPLEATGIALVERAIDLIASYFPRSGNMRAAADKYNTVMGHLYEDSISFIKLHYLLNGRDDHPFWTDNRKPEGVPEALKAHMLQWQHNYPRPMDFERWIKMFGDDSYQYILLGLGHQPDLKANASSYGFGRQAEAEFSTVKMATQNAMKAMPSHREIIEKIHASKVHFGQK